MAVKEAPIPSLNNIVINSRLTKECDAFLNASVFGVHTANGSFKLTVSNLCLFISVLKSHPMQWSKVKERPKRIGFSPFLYKKYQFHTKMSFI